MMKICLIRHGETDGNIKKQYIGRTDLPLCAIGRETIQKKRETYPDAERIFVSPMKRCVETAQIIYPNRELICLHGLRECDFGDFEGKSYAELKDLPEYRAFVESGGKQPFPNGEAHADFAGRVLPAFLQGLSEAASFERLAFVVHGGTIMAILAHYAAKGDGMYAFQVPCGGGFLTNWDGERLWLEERF